MMSRTQISIDEELLARARKRAAQLDVSLAEYVRRLLERDLAGRRQPADVSAVFDLGSSKGTRIARDKDTLVAAAFERRLQSRGR
jgi:Arc/MetJ family transcription regulator